MLIQPWYWLLPVPGRLRLMGAAGIGPATYAFKVRCSRQLSYTPRHLYFGGPLNIAVLLSCGLDS